MTLSGDMCTLAANSYFNTFSLEAKVKEIERLKGNFSRTDWLKSLVMKRMSSSNYSSKKTSLVSQVKLIDLYFISNQRKCHFNRGLIGYVKKGSSLFRELIHYFID